MNVIIKNGLTLDEFNFHNRLYLVRNSIKLSGSINLNTWFIISSLATGMKTLRADVNVGISIQQKYLCTG